MAFQAVLLKRITSALLQMEKVAAFSSRAAKVWQDSKCNIVMLVFEMQHLKWCQTWVYS